MRLIPLNHLEERFCAKFHLRGLIHFCKLYHVWDSQPSMLVSYIEDLARQVKKIKGVYMTSN